MNSTSYTYDDGDQMTAWLTGDSDGDGCTDYEEVGADKTKGGLRDWLIYRDFYDITNASGVIGAKDKGVSGFDLNMILQWGGAVDNGPPNSNGKDYDDDSNGNGLEDGWEIDFAGALGGPGSGPDGGISGPDLSQVLAEGGHRCVSLPTAGSSVTYSYDANGNLIGRGSDTFTYDHEDRLTQAVIGGATTSYAYNGDGLRVSHTSGGVTTSYIWDVASPLPVVIQETTGSQSTRYIYGLDLVYRIDGTAPTYYLYDGLGSTAGLASETGALVGGYRYKYDAFGIRRGPEPTTANAFRFTGEQRDVGTGFYYLRARFYDAGVGRFLSQDPWPGLTRFPQSLNRYAYVVNNPANYTDPYGLCVFGAPCPGPAKKVIDAAGDAIQCAGNAFDCVEGAAHSLGETLDDLGYLDVNATICLGVCISGGFQASFADGLHPYVGTGFGFGAGLSATLGLGQQITTGWNCGLQVSAGFWAAQAGVNAFGFDKEGRYTQGAFGEVGLTLAASTPTYTCVYVF